MTRSRGFTTSEWTKKWLTPAMNPNIDGKPLSPFGPADRYLHVRMSFYTN